MNNNNSKSFFIFLGVFILASVVRFVFSTNKYILNIIAGINVIAFWYVCYLILESVQNTFISTISNTDHIGDGIKIKKKKYFQRHISFYRFFILIFGLAYILFGANSIINDIISLLSLFLSIETNHICTYIHNFFTKKK